ncbi:hypothetical protein LTR35_008937 [Friedmanniomyces endolithicus]|nr:hypothetical protein LTR35_008937 [Friedmanniomyces endolithicus]KAK1016442.1 hypothetical protein LTR54_003120 [Friedmanniomyces endolithicus]
MICSTTENDAGNGSPGPGWRGDPVRTTTEFVPSVATAEATNCASLEIQGPTSSSEYSSSVEFQGSKDTPTDDSAANLAKGISTVGATSSPEATPAQSPTGQSAQSWASEEDGEHMMILSLPSLSRGSGAVCDNPTTAFERSENGPTGGAEALPALLEPRYTASVVSPASPVTTPAAEATLKVGIGLSTSTSPTFSPSSLFDGPNQTLMAPPLDTNFSGFDPNSFMASPQPSYPDSSYTSQFGYGNMGFDLGLRSAVLKRNFEGSGNITPQDVKSNSMFTFPEAPQGDVLL